MSEAAHLSLGKRGEELAANYLLRKGYQILARNLKLGRVEIDILARDGKTVVFVEVKTRASEHFGRPEESVTVAKLKRLRIAATVYERDHPEVRSFRLDVISLLISSVSGESPRLRHYRGVGENVGLARFV